ncbi:palmitoyltransferase AKR1 Ecym_1330 [Eremothecium cymbalariae DBVPG|uniref:Palmitoyltransferase n=1 Tax=Eremothecium cymbalariae (strain CBS 270.75 / DBVPG 7215 / KCTC 17166 / NRRL Y-17582) TaxID=931890 RepID=G8JNA1_ERECY|nr:hypothetical protein Ecym_1330 [Eremothecium cymbalariae DBVPG\
MSSNMAEREELLNGDDVSISSIQPIVSDIALDDDGEQNDKIQGYPVVDESDKDPIVDERVKDPIIEKYHNACQFGDLKTVKEMVETGVIDVNQDWDSREKVSGLHWASVNNRLNIVKYLISQGADVNMKGGDLEATPLHWASKSGYVYIVHCLLENNADPTIYDKQGYNLLHTATFSSNIMLILYVLFTEKIHIDSPDPTGKTPLHWAAYQGDSLTVEALVRFGANVKVLDSNGFTPIHWGTVNGQYKVLKELIEHGSDVFQKNNDGKNCFNIAKEMKTESSLETALYECGFNKNGFAIRKYFKNSMHAKTITFVTPGIVLPLIIGSFAHYSILFALLFSISIIGLVRYLLFNFVFPSYILKRHGTIHNTPLLSGLLAGTIFWMFFIWITRNTLKYHKGVYANIILPVLFITVSSLLVILMQSDPGSIPASSDPKEIRATMSELLRIGKFDAKHFCIHSWVRIPLRSKYKTARNVLIARYDHYCPWVYNQIGFCNHKIFLFFIMFLQIGVFIFVRLSIRYFELEWQNLDDIQMDCRSSFCPQLCKGYYLDPFHSFMLAWVCFQTMWVVALTFVQIFEASKGVTDYEYRLWVRKRRGISISEETFSSVPEELIEEDDSEASEVIVQSNPNSEHKQCGGLMSSVMGCDMFINIVKSLIKKQTQDNSTRLSRNLEVTVPIETNYGWRQNLQDFWLTSDLSAPYWRRFFLPPAGSFGLLNGEVVDYYKLYKLPKRTISAEDIV